MELEFETRGLKYAKPLLREVQAQEQTQELRLTEGMPDLGRILGTWGQVILRGKEWRSDTVSFSGGVMAFVLYAPEDGSDLRTLESWIPFQMKWDLDDAGREGEIRVQCLLRFLDARSVSPRKIMLRCGVSALAEAFREDTAEISLPGQVPEDVQLLRSRYPLRIPKEAGEKTFQLEETIPAQGLGKMVSYTLTPKISECRILSGRLVFRGTAVLHVVALTPEGKLESRDLELPFSQFEQLEKDYSGDAQADCRMAITSLEAEPAEGDQIHVKAGLAAQYLTDDREMVELVEDAYSPRRQVEPKREELEIPQLLDRQRVPISVRQTLRENGSSVADVVYLPDFPTIRRGENVQMELPGQFQALWYDENGILQNSTARTEENWDMIAGEDARIRATVLPGASPTATMGSGMELKGETVLDISGSPRQGMPMVRGLELGEPVEPSEDRPSLILRRAGDAGLWEIAKSTGSTVEAIRRANGLDTEPESNRILLIPVS